MANFSRKNFDERFWSKVRIGSPDQCWEWTASRKPFGYGQMSGYKRSPAGNWVPENAHVVSWRMANGPIPEGMCVCHTCDNPPCVNPAHLFLGTQADNQKDRKNKGRVHRAAGEEASRAKLTETNVRAIRADPRRHRLIAREHGIAHKYVSQLKRRKAWRHLA